MDLEGKFEGFCNERIGEILKEARGGRDTSETNERMDAILRSLSDLDRQWLDDYLVNLFLKKEDVCKQFYIAGIYDAIAFWEILQNIKDMSF